MLSAEAPTPSRRRVVGLLAILALAGCAKREDAVVGLWVCETSPLITLHFYADGVVTMSSVGILRLKWERLSRRLIRISAWNDNLVFDFSVEQKSNIWRGTLSAAGRPTLSFKKCVPD